MSAIIFSPCRNSFKCMTGLNSFLLRNIKNSFCVSKNAETKGNEDVKSEIKPNMDNDIIISNLEKEKADIKLKFDELEDKYKRSLAETENVRKRLQRQISDAKLFGIQAFCKDLLEVADILSKATNSVQTDQLSTNQSLASLFNGLQMTNDQLNKVFSKHGLEIISPPIGEKFNPNVHEALFQQPMSESSSHKTGEIAAVTKPGYKLHDRTIRPALVGVFQ